MKQMENRTDGATCDYCQGFVPVAFLARCPVNGDLICLACQQKPAADDVCGDEE